MTMLTQPISKRYTPQYLLEMPDNASLELVDGRIVEKNVSIESSEIELLFSFPHCDVSAGTPRREGISCIAWLLLLPRCARQSAQA